MKIVGPSIRDFGVMWTKLSIAHHTQSNVISKVL